MSKLEEMTSSDSENDDSQRQQRFVNCFSLLLTKTTFVNIKMRAKELMICKGM